MRGLLVLFLAFVAFSTRAEEQPTFAQFGKAAGDIGTALEARDFERLEKIHDEFLASRMRTTDGLWMTEAFEQAFDSSFSSRTPARLDDLIDKWRARSPNSRLRVIAEAFIWQARAWRARGSGCSPAWVAGAREVYDRNLERAARALDADPAAKESPLWYTAAIRVAGSRQRPAGEIEALLEEGERRHPAYRPLYWARATFLLPSWGGDYAEVDRFVRAAVERTRATEGSSFYAGLYLDLVRNVPCGDPLADSGVSWPDMERGFLDMIERHDAPWNWNLLGTFACRFRDAEATARVLGKLGEKADFGAWSPGVSTQGCRLMLRPVPPRTRVSRAPLQEMPVLFAGNPRIQA
jgi:hypothetical protein